MPEPPPPSSSDLDDPACPAESTPGWDAVDESSWESFPASDPPGWTRTVARPAEVPEPPVQIETEHIWRHSPLAYRLGRLVARLPRPIRERVVRALPRRGTNPKPGETP